VVRDDPTNNVPDTIFSKLGMQLHRRDQHPIGILKNAIHEYFDTSYPNKFDKFDDLCPIVSVKQVSVQVVFNNLLQIACLCPSDTFLLLTSFAHMMARCICCTCYYLSLYSLYADLLYWRMKLPSDNF
jgi:hypothetical protein